MINFRKLWRWLLITLGIITIKSTTCTKPDEFDYVHDYSYFEHQVLEEINKHRESLALNKLETNDKISEVCQLHSEFMAKNLIVCHDGFVYRMESLKQNINAKSVGEVVAFGYSTAVGVVNGWLKSDSHRPLLERDSYTDFGVSACKNEQGRYYFTVIFTKQ